MNNSKSVKIALTLGYFLPHTSFCPDRKLDLPQDLGLSNIQLPLDFHNSIYSVALCPSRDHKIPLTLPSCVGKSWYSPNEVIALNQPQLVRLRLRERGLSPRRCSHCSCMSRLYLIQAKINRLVANYWLRLIPLPSKSTNSMSQYETSLPPAETSTASFPNFSPTIPMRLLQSTRLLFVTASSTSTGLV
jgi:hypothetical protein